MNCKICQKEPTKIFIAKVLNKYDAQYLHCNSCGYIFTENPFWLNEAYASPMNISDTGIMQRNLFNSVFTLNIIYYFFNKNETYLDYASGYGVFVRLMRDLGVNFKWQDDFSENLLARGFEYTPKDDKISLVTSYEVFEHFVNPLEEIEKILKISNNILFSTMLLPVEIPEPNDWWYYAFDHGQHVSFYSKKTFQFIAKKYGLNYYTNGSSLHFLTIKKINPFIFKFLSNSKISNFASVFIKTHFKSKTWADYLLMSKNNLNENII